MEGGNRPHTRSTENSESYEQLRYERDRLAESLEFTHNKCERQGLFLAGLADFIEAHYDRRNEFESVVMGELKQFLTNEVQIMKERIKAVRQNGG